MAQTLLYIVIFALVPVASLAENGPYSPDSPAVIIKSYDSLRQQAADDFNELQEGDIAVFDLDNTVFREVQMLGTDEWFEEMVHLIGQKKGPFLDKAHLHRVNEDIKNASPMKLMEQNTPRLIRDLQKRGVITIGLTARHPRLALITNTWLEAFDIEFSRSSYSDKRFRFWQDMGLGRDFGFSGGIAFVDGAPKGAVLKAILDFTGHRPKRAIAIDDRIKHVHSFVELFLERGIRADVIHYLRVREEPAFDSKTAQQQLEHFLTTGLLLSDQKADRYIAAAMAMACEAALAVDPTL